MHVVGREKFGYLTGEIPQPSPKDPTYNKWRANNALVKGWLINSMSSTLMGNFIRLPTAKAVWDAVAKTYYDGLDMSQVYELTCKAFQMRQNGRPITAYYSDLQGIWQELDHRCPSNMECAADAATWKKQTENQRVYVFLAGLDPELDKVCSDVMRMDPFPDVEVSFAHVRREAQRQVTMMNVPEVHEGSAMVFGTQRNGVARPSFSSIGSSLKNTKTRECSYCGDRGHIRETCFKLIGFLDWCLEQKEQQSQKKDKEKGRKGKALQIASQPSLVLKVDQPSTNNSSSTSLVDSGSPQQGNDWLW
ncbi:putative transcription factor interactor and regulator CCHC(Zn) family [Rosa chinensis]|uniref:Putative transcription factor interactor and regulator CCHC(Zn) family n=1 Tax=Rosa chinensis TaxID=74649 RepID=A0A2P6SDV8_ROSCH|nr:putative transcription factor interactor and regulator CCHC(Zn) family [Rosa chinensis]